MKSTGKQITKAQKTRLKSIKRFKKERPDVVKTLKQILKEQEIKAKAKKKDKEMRRKEREQKQADNETDEVLPSNPQPRTVE